MTTIKDAKEIWNRFNMLPRFGPIVAFLDPDDQPDKELLGSLKRLKKDIEKVTQDIKAENESKIVYAPSPWHAAIFLYSELEQFNRANVSSTEKPIPIRCFYRGQNNSDWPIIATLFRKDANQERENYIMDLFVSLLDCLIPWEHSNDQKFAFVHPGRLALQSIGRHHGISSSLIDFTADPAVAIYFACKNSSASNAVVFTIPAIVAWKQAGLTIVLPPPLSHRLYEQRGIFLLPPDKFDLRSIAWEIRFPPDPDFQLIRDNKLVDLSKANEWIEKLIALVRLAEEKNIDKKFLLSSQENNLSAREIQKLYTETRLEEDALEWAYYGMESLSWFLWYVAETSEGLVPMHSDFELKLIARDNANMLLLVAQLMDEALQNKGFPKGGTQEWRDWVRKGMAEQARTLRKAAAENDDEHRNRKNKI